MSCRRLETGQPHTTPRGGAAAVLVLTVVQLKSDFASPSVIVIRETSVKERAHPTRSSLRHGCSTQRYYFHSNFVFLQYCSWFTYFTQYVNSTPIPVAARIKAWVCGRSLARIAGSNPAGGMGICLLWVSCIVVLSGRGLCVEPTTDPEEPYRVWCVCVWSRNLTNQARIGLLRHKKKYVPIYIYIFPSYFIYIYRIQWKNKEVYYGLGICIYVAPHEEICTYLYFHFIYIYIYIYRIQWKNK